MTTMKKFITFLMAIVLTFCLFGCDSCKDDNTGKTNPMLSNPSGVFASVKEGDFTYSISRSEMYASLRKDTGATTLMTMIDKYLLEKQLNDDGKSYYSAVTAEEIKETIDKDIYGDNKDDLTTEEKAEKEQDFLDTMFTSYGISTTDVNDAKIMEQYRLSLAEKAYALKVLKDEIKENDKKYAEYEALTDEEKANAENPVTAPYYADSKYETEYNKDNYNTYKAIVVPFTTEVAAKAALAAIGVKAVNGAWVDATTNVNLTATAVLAKYIQLYNLVLNYEGETLTQESEVFKYTESELSGLNSNVLARVKKMTSYDANATTGYYYAEPYVTSSGSLFVYVLKLAQTDAKVFADLSDTELTAVKEQYLPKLHEASLTATYIQTKMAELRKANELKIYDSVIEAAYYSTVKNYSVEYTLQTEEQASVVASITGKEFTADDLFTQMEKVSSNATLVDLLVYKKFLVNTDYNKYYNFDTKVWTDEKKSKEFDETIKSEKTNFTSGNYTENGYDPAVMSWTTFMGLNYGVTSEEEFKLLLLSQQVISDYKAALNYLENHEKDADDKEQFKTSLEDATASVLWTQINAAMQKAANEYFSVKGIHLLVSAYKNPTNYVAGNTALDPEDWTAEQKQGAVDLINEIKDYVLNSTGTYKEKLQRIVDAYKVAPIGQEAETNPEYKDIAVLVSDVTPKTIHISKYKALGLYVKYEDLGTFTNGQMVETFNDAVKSIWDADVTNSTTSDTVIKNVTIYPTAIETKYGYHLYINLESNKVTYVDEDAKRVIPTLEEIRKFVISETISTNAKSAINTYYVPYQKEIAGDYFSSVMQYNSIKKVIGTLETTGTFDSAAVSKYLGLYLDYTFETYLTKVTKDFVE